MNKGFTLVELMAVLVLIVIIASIGYAGITAVQRNINQNLWEATVEEIETGAVKYGQDNLNALNPNETCNIDGSETRNCIEVTVEFLIDSNYIDTDENGFVKSSADFDNKNAVKDFSWVGTVLTNGATINITIFFEMEEGYQVEKDLMLLEVDFYIGKSGIKKGEDIVLLNCTKK